MHSIDAAYRYRWIGVVYPSVRPSVRLSVCVGTTVRSAETAKPVEMPFGDGRLV